METQITSLNFSVFVSIIFGLMFCDYKLLWLCIHHNRVLNTKKIALIVLCVQGIQFSSVAQLCPTPYDPMNCSTPGLPVHHQLLESTQTHVH